METTVLAALREASAALTAAMPLLPHEPGCQALPIQSPATERLFPSGLPCDCARAVVAQHSEALRRMVGRKNHRNNKKGGGR